MDGSRIGVVVVNYRDLDATRRCLRSIQQQGVPGLCIAVVDNSSAEESAEELVREHTHVHLISMPENRGYAGGNNAGMRFCLEEGCDWVLVLNNDAMLEPGAIEALCRCSRASRVVAPQVRDAGAARAVCGIVGDFDWGRGRWGKLLRSDAQAQRVQAASGTCLMFPGKVLDSVGYFDERYFLYYEDVDLMARLAKAGVEVWYEPSAIVLHDVGRATGSGHESPLSVYYNNRNRLLLMRTWATPAGWRRFIRRFIATRLLVLLRYAICADFRRCRAVLEAIKDFRAGRFGRSDEWHRPSSKERRMKEAPLASKCR